MIADRRQHLTETIEPALAGGDVVLCDRYADASRAYQGAGRGLGEAAVDALHRTFAPLTPDRTYLFDLPGRGRARARRRAERHLRRPVRARVARLPPAGSRGLPAPSPAGTAAHLCPGRRPSRRRRVRGALARSRIPPPRARPRHPRRRGVTLIPQAPVVLLAGPGAKRLEALALDEAAHVVCRYATRREPPCPTVPTAAAWRRASTRTSSSRRPSVGVASTRLRSRRRRARRRRRCRPRSSARSRRLATQLPYEAKRRAIVLLDVDRTEPAAYSALLKILEEPPSKALFLLTATRPRLLPPTILSRVLVHALPAVPRAETAAALRARGMAAEEAEARAALAPPTPRTPPPSTFPRRAPSGTASSRRSRASS